MRVERLQLKDTALSCLQTCLGRQRGPKRKALGSAAEGGVSPGSEKGPDRMVTVDTSIHCPRWAMSTVTGPGNSTRRIWGPPPTTEAATGHASRENVGIILFLF